MKSKTRTSGYINTKRKYRNTMMDMAIIIFVYNFTSSILLNNYLYPPCRIDLMK